MQRRLAADELVPGLKLEAYRLGSPVCPASDIQKSLLVFCFISFAVCLSALSIPMRVKPLALSRMPGRRPAMSTRVSTGGGWRWLLGFGSLCVLVMKRSSDSHHQRPHVQT